MRKVLHPLILLWFVFLGKVQLSNGASAFELELVLDKDARRHPYCYKQCPPGPRWEDAKKTVFTEDKWLGFCKHGKLQSPVDLQTGTLAQKEKDAKEVTWYVDAHFNMPHPANPLFNCGTTIYVDTVQLHSMKFTFDYGKGKAYNYYLKNVHFHWGNGPNDGSEHTIDGKRYAVEVHFVFVAESVTASNLDAEWNAVDHNGQAKYFIIAIMVESTTDKQSRDYESIFQVLEPYNDNQDQKSPIDLEDFKIAETEITGELNFFSLLRETVKEGEKKYYEFTGSFTGPTCYEPVTWAIMKAPLKWSDKQLGYLRNIKVKGQPISGNCRSLQGVVPTAERPVEIYKAKVVEVKETSGGNAVHKSSVLVLSFFFFMTVLCQLIKINVY